MKIKHVIRIIIFAALSCGIIWFLSGFLQVANERDTVGLYGFYLEPEDSIDVVLIGPSEVYTSFYSPLAYEQEGFTSYSLATSAMTGALYKPAVREALATQNPQAFVFDFWGFCYDEQKDEAVIRKFVDSIPNSETRTQTIDELVVEENRESFYKPFLKYHANWDNFVKCYKVFKDKRHMDSKGYSITKNFSTNTMVAPVDHTKHKYKISKEGLEELKNLLAYLKEQNIENVLFIRTPEMEDYSKGTNYDTAIKLIEDAGYNFEDLNEKIDEIGLDEKKDYYNKMHLNIYGTEKITAYIASYIMDKYNIDTDHSEEVKKEWDDCASYNSKIIKKCKEYTDKNKKIQFKYQSDFIN